MFRTNSKLVKVVTSYVVFHLLLNKYFNFNEFVSDKTPAHLASSHGNSQTLQEVLRKGVVNIQNYFKKNFLKYRGATVTYFRKSVFHI